MSMYSYLIIVVKSLCIVLQCLVMKLKAVYVLTKDKFDVYLQCRLSKLDCRQNRHFRFIYKNFTETFVIIFFQIDFYDRIMKAHLPYLGLYNAQDFAQILYLVGGVCIINRNNVFHSFPDREITCPPCFFVYYCQHAKLNIS